MNGPLVSVLIPCFNAERFIAETLRSVAAQTYESIEIIVVDDGSTDRSVDVVRSLSVPRLKLLTQKNAGAAAARNAAFSASVGALIQFLDADDLISANKISAQVARLKECDGSVAMCSWRRFFQEPGDGELNPEANWHDMDPVDWLVEARSLGGGMLFPAMWLVPREVILNAGPWREDLSLNDDGEFFTRVVLSARKVLFSSEGTAYYRSGNTDSLSGRKSDKAWRSGFEAIRSCVAAARTVEDSERVRRCGSFMWQVFAHASYPYHRKLANAALLNASALHRDRIRPEGGMGFNVVSRLIGWKAARVLQRWSGRS